MATAPKDELQVLEKKRVRHLSRYERHIREGMSIEAIAKEDRVSIFTVQQSITKMKAFMEMATLTELERVQIATLVTLAAKERKTLDELLSATYKDEKGVTVADVDTRLKAIKLINEKIEAIKPRGNGNTTQIAVLPGGSGGEKPSVTVTSGSGDFEGILRRVRQSRGQLGPGNPPPEELEATTVEGDIVEEEPTSAGTATEG